MVWWCYFTLVAFQTSQDSNSPTAGLSVQAAVGVLEIFSHLERSFCLAVPGSRLCNTCYRKLADSPFLQSSLLFSHSQQGSVHLSLGGVSLSAFHTIIPFSINSASCLEWVLPGHYLLCPWKWETPPIVLRSFRAYLYRTLGPRWILASPSLVGNFSLTFLHPQSLPVLCR